MASELYLKGTSETAVGRLCVPAERHPKQIRDKGEKLTIEKHLSGESSRSLRGISEMIKLFEKLAAA